VRGIGTAAAAAVVAAAVLYGRDGAKRTPATTVVAAGAPGSVITTGIGVRDSVRLPDGTRVILAPASRLAVSPGYGHGSREVTLEGMAWLSVRHDTASPFTLHLGQATVRDVGTEFTARADGEGASGSSVAVTEGSVELRGASPSSVPVTLVAGDRGVVQADGRVVAERGRVSEDDVAWTRGRLIFREAPMAEVRADLRRWYGVDLRFADSTLARRRITATFEGESVDRVIQVVALALGAVVERRDSVVLLRTGAAR
jgi:transmembrane sensor